MAGRESLMLNIDQLTELKEKFDGFDLDGNKNLSEAELGEALASVNIKLAGYEIRNLLQKYDKINKDDKISFEEFQHMYMELRQERDFGRLFKKHVKTRDNVETKGGTTEASSSGTTHSVRKEEQVAFADWINRGLGSDPDCKELLPLNEDGSDLYAKCKNGILLCKMVNLSVPETIDERTINKTNLSVYRRHENHMLALNSAQSIGCNIVNIGATDVEAGTVHLILGLLWQVIKIGLLSEVNLHDHPGLIHLLEEGETIEDLLKLSPEAILIRWVNFHLRNSSCGRQIKNLTEDIKDSVVYLHLLQQISPPEFGVNTMAEMEGDLTKRAEGMLGEADKIGCRAFVGPADVVSGNAKLNLAFVANLFNTYPALDLTNVEQITIEETREERTYRNWMNSLGVSPFVNYIYNDLCNGLVLFQLYNIIKPGIVDPARIQKTFKPTTKRFKEIENGNYAIELGQKCKFSLVGIGGQDIVDGNQTLTLALVWQLMRAYTLAILTRLTGTDKPIEDKQIIEWANEKLKSSGKTSKVTSFHDSALSDARVILDLIDALQPGAISPSTVRDCGPDGSDEDKLANAKYAISMARKIGCRVYALPEDIVEVNQKMVMTVFACLMTKAYDTEQQS